MNRVNLLHLLAAWATLVPAGAVQVSPEIIKPENDERLYKGITLDNGIKAVLISDPKADKAGAGLAVSVGAMSDPDDIPGMAHFLEHMLFLGTDKYPDEGYYQKFLSTHGGLWNAETGRDYTVYFFEVGAEFLNETLDIFSQFFISPRFDEAAAEREANAVDSEYLLRIREEPRRVNAVYRAIAEQDHDFARFGVGSVASLWNIAKSKGINTRDEMVKFWRKWYSSNMMTLVILGKEDLTELEGYAVTYFSPIKNRNAQPPSWKSPFTKPAVKKYVKIKTLQDANEAMFIFPITDLNRLYKSKPNVYLEYILANTGTGGLDAWLKEKGWIQGSVASGVTYARGFGILTFGVSLTDEGEKHIGEIGQALFQDIDIIQRNGPQKRIYDELAKIRELNFENKGQKRPFSLVKELALNLQKYEIPEVLSGGELLFNFEPEKINQLVESLNPDNLFIVQISRKFNDSDLDKKEKYYNVSYSVKPIEESFLKVFENPGENEKLQLPLENPYIPDTVELTPRDSANGDVPELILSDDLMEVWYYQDKEYLVPKGYLWIQLVSPLANVDPYHTAMGETLAMQMTEAFVQEFAPATYAGLAYKIESNPQGLSITISGYNVKQGTLVKNLFKQIAEFKVNTNTFSDLKDAYIRQLKNFALKPGTDQLGEYMGELSTEGRWSNEELLKAANGITTVKLQGYHKLLLLQLHIIIFGSGNYQRKDILTMAQAVRDALQSTSETVPLSLASVAASRVVSLFEGENSLFQRPHPVDVNTALINYYQCGISTPRNDLLVTLLGQIVKPLIYHQLRTKQQLGYIVEAAGIDVGGVVAVITIVSSARPPDYLEKQIDAFFKELTKTLDTLTDEEFERQKNALAIQRFAKPITLAAKTKEAQKEIKKRQFNFKRKEMEKSIVEEITKQELIDMFNSCLNPMSKKRRLLRIWVVGAKAIADGYNLEAACQGEITCVHSQTEFRKEHPLAPNPKPFETFKEIEEKCPRNCRAQA